MDEPVYFVAHELRRRWPELTSDDAWVDVASVPASRLHERENTWIVSTYLRLRGRSMNVRIVDRLRPDAINVCASARLIQEKDAHRCFIVVADADRRGLIWGDFHVVQSPAMLRGRSTCLLDHWPQPGIAPRSATRGDRVERVAYFGYPGNLARQFRRSWFVRELQKLGVEFVLRERSEEWHDYGDVDLCLAVRDLSPYWIATKPSTKLVQSWIAGCPALLGREPAYRHWGERGADYFEVRSPREAVATVERLRSEPALYRRAVELGRAKAPLHNEESVSEQWKAVLAGPIFDQFQRWRTRRLSESGRRTFHFALLRILEPMQRGWFRVRAEGPAVAFRAVRHGV